MSSRTILITGGTGSFGRGFVNLLLNETDWTIRILSRSEHLQLDMERELEAYKDRLRFFLGDVRDLERVKMAFKGVDYVVHAAAYKCVQKAETDPFETVKTNILGTQNVIQASLSADVDSVLLISTDKAVEPINLYGSTKMVAERLMVAANAYRGIGRTKLCATRYGNVAGTRSTVVPIFMGLRASGTLPVSDKNSTRFWITLRDANKFVLKALRMASESQGGEIYVPQMASIRLTDLAKCIGGPNINLSFTGLRPGDKLHESLITLHESSRVVMREGVYVIQPESPIWPYTKVYTKQFLRDMTSGDNKFLTLSEIKDSIEEYLVPAQ